MPQLDTSTWLTTIISMLLALFIFLQIKISNHSFPSIPLYKTITVIAHKTPWENKWTKIYLPHSLPLH
uniref:ATP synthase complex subunit 8 n=1 Tax=Lariscus insignis TaxID=226558 RepID=A0A162KGK9_9SCIU|nr:ATP synthase F0 subunit 8 [Lariscus insignis]ALP86344.1 ATP synthase F0 subunit 8 [Lariscus insignis]